jgi:hypothetical protein
MLIIVLYLRERNQRILNVSMLAGVFAGVVIRNSLYNAETNWIRQPEPLTIKTRNRITSVMTVVFCHLVTEQVGQSYVREKQQQMAIVTGTSVSNSFLFFCQLLEQIGSVIVYGNQACMSPMQWHA